LVIHRPPRGGLPNWTAYGTANENQKVREIHGFSSTTHTLKNLCRKSCNSYLQGKLFAPQLPKGQTIFVPPFLSVQLETLNGGQAVRRERF